MLGNRTIVLIENEENDVLLLQQAMKKAGDTEHLKIFADGEDALKYLQEIAVSKCPFPDAILMDLKMPGLSGLEVLTRLKNNPGTKSIPVFILTLSELEQDIIDAYQFGASAYLIKPFTIADLESMMKSVISFCARCAKSQHC